MPCLIGNQASCEIQDAVFTGLIAIGIVFAIDSAVHSYLILAYSQSPQGGDPCWLLLYGERRRTLDRHRAVWLACQHHGLTCLILPAIRYWLP